jgi:hypothetical protein
MSGGSRLFAGRRTVAALTAMAALALSLVPPAPTARGSVPDEDGSAGAGRVPAVQAAATALRDPHGDVCPPPEGDGTAPTTFDDLGTGPHAANVECMAGYGIARGGGDGSYRPAADVTRAQMALFIVRFLTTAGVELQRGGGGATFGDTAGIPAEHRDAIERLAHAGVVRGQSESSFAPNATISRAQMATFIGNAIDLADNGSVDRSAPPDASRDHFRDDDGAFHEPAIDRLAEQGIVAGVAARTYQPAGNVTRAQMASFIMRGASYLHEIGAWAPTQDAGEEPGEPESLAEVLLGDAGLASRLAATRTALASGGVVVASDGDVATASVEPTASWNVTAQDVVALALDARNTEATFVGVPQLAEMLEEAGWPFESGTPIEAQLLATLRTWIVEAEADPDDPAAFAIRFVAAMVAERSPGTDLRDPATVPAAVGLSALEVLLLDAAIDRDVIASTPLPEEARAAAKDCTSFIEERVGKLGKILSEAAKVGGSIGTGKLLEKVLGPKNSKNVSNKLQALSLVGTVAKLVHRYRAVDANLVLESDSPIHRPVANRDGRLLAGFAFTAGIDREHERAFREANDEVSKALQDCLSYVGLPEMPGSHDLKEVLPEWRVRWKLYNEHPGRHVHISLDVNDFYLRGAMEHRLTPNPGGLDGSARLFVDLVPERLQDHLDGELKTTDVHVKASLKTDTPPPPSIFVNPSLKDAIPALAELTAGLVQNLWTTDRWATLVVEYHDWFNWCALGQSGSDVHVAC